MFKYSIALVLFMFYLLLSSTIVFAEVTGTVKDTMGAPVVGATVTFTDESNTNNVFSATTDSNGSYNLIVGEIQPPSNVVVSDVPNDNGHQLQISWVLSPDDKYITKYNIYRSRNGTLTEPVSVTNLPTLESLKEAEKTTTILIGSVGAGVNTYLDQRVPLNGTTYYYWIAAVIGSVNSKKVAAGFFTAVEDDYGGQKAFSLDQNYPNPFNPSTVIPFSLAKSGNVNLTIYNIQGQKVRTLSEGFFSAGNHSITWNGNDNRGKTVSAGVYFFQLRAGSRTETKKMLLLDGGGGFNTGGAYSGGGFDNGVSSHVAKPSMSSGTQRVAKVTAGATYTVTITHSGIVPYEKKGVTITDSQTMDFVVGPENGSWTGYLLTEQQGYSTKGDAVISFGVSNKKVGIGRVDFRFVSVTMSGYNDVNINNDGSFYFSDGHLTVRGTFTSNNSCTGSASYHDDFGTFGESMEWIADPGFIMQGHILENNTGLSGVTVKITDYLYTISSSTGAYGFRGIPNGIFTFTPVLDGYTFIPPSLQVTVNGADIKLPDIAAIKDPVFNLQGRVLENNTGLSGVTVSLSGNGQNHFATTSSTGDYTFSVRNGKYTLTNHLYGYTFTPPSAEVTVNGTDITFPDIAAVQIDFASLVIMKPIPAGSFSMGQEGIDTPVHTVTLSSFEMSAFEITQGLYNSLVGSNPSKFIGDDNLPVENMSWFDAIKFCNRLSTKGGFQPCYDDSSGVCDYNMNGFRLPTEAEWEYACRAGSTTIYNLGNENSDLERAGWYYQNSSNKTHPVGEKTPNAWGLYDMHGNVSELCNDWYGDYTSGSATNPIGAPYYYVAVRGGDWSSYNFCQSAYRNTNTPSSYKTTGFRVIRRDSFRLEGNVLGNNSGLTGVIVNLSGNGLNLSATLSPTGEYTFQIPNGSYTITPVLTGYTFTPSSVSVTVNGANITIPDIKKDPVFSVIGKVLENNTGLIGVTMNLSGNGLNLSATSSPTGEYTFQIPNGSYTITPVLYGCTFTPSSVPVTVNGANITIPDITKISFFNLQGHILENNTGLSGVNVILSGNGPDLSVMSSPTGSYSFQITNGTYTIIPGLYPYFFTPPSVQVTVNGADITVQDIDATKPIAPVGTTEIQGIKLVSILAGSFQMGDEAGDEWSQPVHTVTLSPFEMSVYEITQGQYEEVIGSNPSGSFWVANLPVEQMSWFDAIKYCNALSEKAGLGKCYDEISGECDFTKNGFRLPTEAEWEYACRAGSTTAYNLGEAESDLARSDWYNSNSNNYNHPVGQKTPNAWGLYDMHGNVSEWCNDWLGYYTSGSVMNPTGLSSGSSRVIRGGNWNFDANDCRSSFRFGGNPKYFSDITIGFRVVRRP